jgi:hypothetical protein
MIVVSGTDASPGVRTSRHGPLTAGPTLLICHDRGGNPMRVTASVHDRLARMTHTTLEGNLHA